MAKPKPKTKPKKAPARPRPRWKKLRALFAEPGVALTIQEISEKLGTKTHSACAAISVLGNPAHTPEPLRINLDRKTGKYSVADTALAGVDSSAKEKAKKKRAAPSRRHLQGQPRRPHRDRRGHGRARDTQPTARRQGVSPLEPDPGHVR